MGNLGWLPAVLGAELALAGCSGGRGEGCKSTGILGAFYCDQGLTCNQATGYTCEKPMSVPEGGPCSSDDLCSAGLWCVTGQQRCGPFLKEGDSCGNPFSCGPALACVKDPMKQGAVCGQQPDAGATAATVVGTLTLPGTAVGAKGTASLFAVLPPGGTALASSVFATDGTPSVDYQILAVPAGSYFVLGFVDVDGSGGTSSTPGDYAGWYGHDGDGNPPASATAVVPDTGTVRFDFSLVLR